MFNYITNIKFEIWDKWNWGGISNISRLMIQSFTWDLINFSVICSSTSKNMYRLWEKGRCTYLMFIKYWARATESAFPLIVIVLSVLPPSRSSQFEIRIIAPDIWRISAILVPPLPMIQPIKSFGTVISCCCWLRLALFVRSWEPANAARAALKSCY